MNAPLLVEDYIAHPPRRLTPAEYLRREESAFERSEYVEGQVRAMAGGTKKHSRIITNLLRRLGNRLDGKPCLPYDSNLKVRVPTRTPSYLYPDVLVACPPEQYEDENETILLNPTVVIEALSKSTANYDRKSKLALYAQIPSLQMCLLIEQAYPHVQTITFERDLGDGNVQPLTLGYHKRLEESVPLPCLGIELPMAEIYERVEFDAV